MPAYSAPITTPACGAHTCYRAATEVVRNGRNELVGYRCARHAAELVEALNAEPPPGGPGGS